MDISSCESPPSPTSMEEDIDESIEDAFMNKLKDKCFSEDLVSQRSAELILQCERDAQRKKLLMEVNFIHYFMLAQINMININSFRIQTMMTVCTIQTSISNRSGLKVLRGSKAI